MRPGNQHGPAGTRARQCISFFILALFLGLFVSAMTAPNSSAMGPQDHVVLSFPNKTSYKPSVDRKNNRVKLTFPGISVVQLQQEYLEPVAMSGNGMITDLRFETAAQEKGACLIISCADNARVRILNAPYTNQVMINVSAPNTIYDTAHTAVLHTNASLHNA